MAKFKAATIPTPGDVKTFTFPFIFLKSSIFLFVSSEARSSEKKISVEVASILFILSRVRERKGASPYTGITNATLLLVIGRSLIK